MKPDAAKSCLFCRMVSGEIAPDVVREDDDLLAFRDINPQAPTHVLVIPKRHVASVTDLAEGDDALVGRMIRAGVEIAKVEGLGERGFRLVLNAGPDSGYSVFHVHLHVLGGRKMSWPPG